MEEANSDVMCPRGFLYQPSLQLVDPVAMLHVLGSQHCYEFPKPSYARDVVLRVVGPGIAAVEGATHRHQRRIMAPAFNTAAVRDSVPLLFEHAEKLSARFGEMVDDTFGPADKPQWPGQTPLSCVKSAMHKPMVDVAYWLSRTTLDVIADFGFSEKLNTIANLEGEKSHEMATHFKHMMNVTAGTTLTQFMLEFLMWQLGLNWLAERYWKDRIAMRKSRAKMTKLCAEIVEKKRRQIREEEELSRGWTGSKADWAAKQSGKRLDLMDRLLRASRSSAEPCQTAFAESLISHRHGDRPAQGGETKRRRALFSNDQ